MFEASADTPNWSRERFLRVALDPDLGLMAGRNLHQIARTAHVAYGWAYSTWRDLVEVGAFVMTDRSTRAKKTQLVEPGNLEAGFRYWIRHRPPRRQADYHVLDAYSMLLNTPGDPPLEYMATTYMAENMLQSHLFPHRIDIYVHKADDLSWHRLLTERGFPIDAQETEKGIVRLIVPDEGPPGTRSKSISDPTALHPYKVRGIRIARPPLLIADLFEEGGACAEAAEKLLRRIYGN